PGVYRRSAEHREHGAVQPRGHAGVRGALVGRHRRRFGLSPVGGASFSVSTTILGAETAGKRHFWHPECESAPRTNPADSTRLDSAGDWFVAGAQPRKKTSLTERRRRRMLYGQRGPPVCSHRRTASVASFSFA